jgi:hypothetical protein
MNAETLPIAGLVPDSTYVDVDKLPWTKTPFPRHRGQDPDGEQGDRASARC